MALRRPWRGSAAAADRRLAAAHARARDRRQRRARRRFGKILENWLYWLVIDSSSVYLYWQRELYLYVALFAVYLVLVVVGLVRWHRDWRAQAVHA
jgi:hypothetical protein